jgi:phage shock protein A
MTGRNAKNKKKEHVMSFGKRLRLIFEMKGNAALDAAEDPTQVMDLSYEKQLEQVQNLRRAIAQVMTEEKHIELLEQQTEAQADHFTTQAQQALHLGHEDLARQALQRKEALLTQVNGYKTQMAQLQAQEAHLAEVESKVEARVTAFKSQKDMLSAQYSAAQASVGANEAVTGLSSETSEMNLAMQRAQDKIVHMQAHADAIDSLMASGTLNAPGEDPLDTQLRQITEEHNVDAELAAMRQQLQLPAPGGEQH